jgi:hypothetical protein
MGTKATTQQKAAFTDRIHALYPRFANGEIDQEPFLEDLQAWIEGKHLGGGLLPPLYQRSDAVKAAAEIMGTNFHGPEAAHGRIGVPFLSEYHEVAAAMPFSPEVLEACKDTHLLVWLAPLSLMEVWDKQTKLFYSKSDPWYGKRAERSWSKAKITAGWYLVRKAEAPDSRFKNWTEQQQQLMSDEEVPSAGVMAQAILIHYLETQERLFENVYVRTSSVDSDGNRVLVGCFGADGLIVGSWGGERVSHFGLASSRKSS